MKKTKSSIKAIAIGKYPSKEKTPKSTKIEILKGRDTLEIEKNLETISNKYLPVLIFLSNEDFSPLIILESGYWGIPIVCINNSRGHQIIKRFLPANCFATIEKIEELHLKKSQFIKCKKNMFDYLNKISEEHFFYQVKSNLSLI